jgi:GntR family transcriptional regulator, transcriptional repressor for pyruvate dehydrogenase complex
MKQGATTSGVATRRTEKKSAVLARRILRDVAGGRLRPGDMLPAEAAMLEEYAVGRTTLREALRILEVQGVIAIRPGPGGGPVVREAGTRGYARASSMFFQLGGLRLLDVMQARAEVEPLIARLAAENRDPEARARVRESTAVLEASEGASGARLREASRSFHEAVAGAAARPVLTLFALALDDLVSDRLARLALSPQQRLSVVARQVAVGRAIVRGSPSVAERLMREHMEDYNRCAAEERSGAVRSVVSWG